MFVDTYFAQLDTFLILFRFVGHVTDTVRALAETKMHF